MAINKNHEFEELDGVKCAIVEKNVSQERVHFLKDLLEWNHFTVVVVPGAPPKPAPPSTTTAVGEEVTVPTDVPLPPATFTVGVTDVTFNPVNAIFGRLLRTKDGRVVTLAFWQQKEAVAQDDVPYFEKK